MIGRRERDQMPALYSNPGVVGYMPMPVSFHYRSTFLQGRPRHERFDDFWRKHPPMDHVHRAKIFAPFDALAGFDECINSKRVLYEEKRILSGSEKDEQNEKLTLLHSYSRGGQYIAITGTVKKVDCSAILSDDMMIALEDIAGIDMCDVNT